MGLPVPTFTDYTTPCGELPRSFIEMLNDSLVSDGTHCYLNLILNAGYCDDLTACFDCDDQGIDPERFFVEHAFALDECGHLGLKVRLNYGSGRQ